MAKAAKKSKYKCLNGPFKGSSLLLATPSTLSFTLGDFQGKYVAGTQVLRTRGCHFMAYARLNDQDRKGPLFVKDTLNIESSTTLIWQLPDGTTPCDPPPKPRTYKVGEKVVMVKDVGDTADGDSPGGVYAEEGDIVVIREVNSYLKDNYNVSHPTVTDGSMFRVIWDEIDSTTEGDKK